MKIKDTVKSAVAQYKQNQPTIKKAQKVVTGAISTFGKVKDAYVAVKTKTTEGVLTAAKKAASDPTGKWNLLGKLKTVGGIASTVTGIATMPGKVATAVKDFRTAVASGSRQDIVNSAKSSIAVAEGAIKTTLGGLTTANTVNKLRGSYKAAFDAFRTAVPGASEKVASAVAKSAMGSTFEGVSRQAARLGAREVAKDTARAVSGTLAKAVGGSASRAVAKAALEGGAHAAVSAASHAGARVAVSTLGKAAARFAPGLNVALAVVDTATAAATLADPKASVGSKVTSCITAAGSIVSATNIPIVSQIGAAVSTVSSLVGAFF
jgi:hypothetical protein